MWFGDEALFSENVCVRDSWHCQVGRGAQGTATLELKKVKLMAKQITTLPKELVGVIRGLANPGLRVEGQKVQLHTQPCLEFEVRQLRRGGEDHGV
jgi:hypothetical protein